MIKALWDEVGRLQSILQNAGKCDAAGFAESGMMLDEALCVQGNLITPETVMELIDSARNEGAPDTVAELRILYRRLEDGDRVLASEWLDDISWIARAEDADYTEMWLHGLVEDLQEEERDHYARQADRLLQVIRTVHGSSLIHTDVEQILATAFIPGAKMVN